MRLSRMIRVPALVEWRDPASNDEDWLPSEEEFTPAYCYSLGWVTTKKDYLLIESLLLSYEESGPLCIVREAEARSNLMSIPLGCVTAIHPIRLL